MKKYLTKRNVYIGLFALLYLSTALVSTIHAVSFFCLANVMTLGVLLAVTFEIGQAATLFSILTSKKDRSKFMPWVLMFILTGVQVLGNVFSSYRYLISNSADQLRYFKEPIFVWMELPDAQANVILTYIIGAVLPIVALALTGMLTNYLEDENTEQNELPTIEPTVIEKEVIKEVEVPVEKIVEKEIEKIVEVPVEKEVIKEVEVPVEKIVEKEVIKEVPVEKEVEKIVEVPVEKIVEKEVIKEVPVYVTPEPTEAPKTIEEKQADELIDNSAKSHFVNL